MLFNFLGWAQNFHFLGLRKHYKNSGFGIFQTGKNTPKLAKMLSQNLVQGWDNWTKFWLNKCVFLDFLFACFSSNSHSPCRKKKIFEQKKTQKTTEKNWTKFWLKKRLFLDQVLTLQHIYIYIYITNRIAIASDIPSQGNIERLSGAGARTLLGCQESVRIFHLRQILCPLNTWCIIPCANGPSGGWIKAT